jgi:hypothetical protein
MRRAANGYKFLLWLRKQKTTSDSALVCTVEANIYSILTVKTEQPVVSNQTNFCQKQKILIYFIFILTTRFGASPRHRQNVE